MKVITGMLVLVCLTAVRGLADTLSPQPQIRLGMSTALTGPAADLGINMRLGVLAGLERANRAGGVNGYHLSLIALDDGYEPARTAPNMRQLLDTDNVLAIIGNVGTPTAIAALPIAVEERTLFYAGFTGAGILRKNPPDRYIINYRASYAEETASMIDALIDRAGLQPQDIAFFTQRDSYGDAGFAGAIAALKRHGLTDPTQVVHVRYERNTLAVENAVATLMFAEHTPRAVVMVGAYAPCAKFIRLAHNSGLDALYLNVSFVGSNPLAEALGNLPVKVIVTQVVPNPGSDDLPIVRDYRADLRAIDPTAQTGFGSLEGYIDSRIFIAGLQNLHGPPTRDGIINALEGLGTFDLGLGQPLSLSPLEHQACHHVWPTVLSNGAFVPLDWKNIGDLVKGSAAP